MDSYIAETLLRLSPIVGQMSELEHETNTSQWETGVQPWAHTFTDRTTPPEESITPLVVADVSLVNNETNTTGKPLLHFMGYSSCLRFTILMMSY